MEWFKNLKISIKLFLSFALIIGVMAVQSWVGHRKVTMVYGQLEQLFSTRLPTLDGLLQVDRDLQQLRVAERSLLQLAPTDAHFEPLLREYEENLQQADRRWTEIRQLFLTEELQALAERYDAARRTWQPVSRQVVDLCRQGTPEARARGLALSLGNAGKLFEAMRGHIDSLTELIEAAAAGEVETARRVSGSTLLQMLALLAVSILAAGIIGSLLYRVIAGPLRQALQMADEMAAGDLSHRLHLAQDDETGQLCRRLDALADALSAHAALAERIARGDLDVRVQLASDKDQFGRALQHMTDQFNELVGRVQVAVEQISSGSAQVSDASQTLSQGSTESAASMEEITASMTEMASQTKLSAQNADQANSLSKGSRGAAQRGDALMKELVGAMAEIDQAGQDINKIIKVIDEIAFQTNLLALNAAVEAARAGQHGKGFAVVAEEVRSLAARSAKAAKETAQLIEDSAEKTRNGSEIADKTAAALKGIVAGAAKASDLVAEIAAAANEQAAGFEQVNQGLGQIDQVTQQNTANAEETAAASEELSGQAMVLKEMIGRYKVRGGMAATGKPGAFSPTRVPAPEPKEDKASARLPAPQPKKKTVSARPAPVQIGQGAVKSAGPAPRKPTAPTPAVETEKPPIQMTEPSKETGPELRPEEVIALDDSEFGRY